jgi:hypothetical protein
MTRNDLVKDNKQVTWYKTLKDKVPDLNASKTEINRGISRANYL